MFLTDLFVISFNEGKIEESLFEEKTDWIGLEKIIGIACSHEVRINRRGLLPKEDLFYTQARNSSEEMNINQSKPNSSKLATDWRHITRGGTKNCEDGRETSSCTICGMKNHLKNQCKFEFASYAIFVNKKVMSQPFARRGK
ncbi:hypothetical protein JTB14_020735 [Gonioctena quinquepunctata]|nr:hypothetical protein JTB14_020735 [Gonioctena quinquepunctata]